MTVYREAEFKDTTVHLDHNAYIRCSFERCTIIFSGAAPGPLIEVQFTHCQWIFDGPAKTTVEMLRLMLNTPLAEDIAAVMLGLIRKEQPAVSEQEATVEERPAS